MIHPSVVTVAMLAIASVLNVYNWRSYIRYLMFRPSEEGQEPPDTGFMGGSIPFLGGFYGVIALSRIPAIGWSWIAFMPLLLDITIMPWPELLWTHYCDRRGKPYPGETDKAFKRRRKRERKNRSR